MKRRVDFFSHFSGVNKKGATDFYIIFCRGRGEYDGRYAMWKGYKAIWLFISSFILHVELRKILTRLVFFSTEQLCLFFKAVFLLLAINLLSLESHIQRVFVFTITHTSTQIFLNNSFSCLSGNNFYQAEGAFNFSSWWKDECCKCKHFDDIKMSDRLF